MSLQVSERAGARVCVCGSVNDILRLAGSVCVYVLVRVRFVVLCCDTPLDQSPN